MKMSKKEAAKAMRHIYFGQDGGCGKLEEKLVLWLIAIYKAGCKAEMGLRGRWGA